MAQRLSGVESGEGNNAGWPYAVPGVADVEGCGRAVAPAWPLLAAHRRNV